MGKILRFIKGFLDGPGSKAAGEDTADYSDLNLPFEFLVVPGGEAVEQRSRLLSRAEITPVIMGNREEVSRLEDLLQDPSDTPEAILARANDLDVEEWIRSRTDEDPGQYSVEPAEWPRGRMPPLELSVHLDVLSRRPKPKVVIGLVPTALAWQVPAFLKFGDWNDCPSPDAQVALHKKWHQEYGSEIACLSGDVIECTVKNPPSSRQSALALAREQFVYCSDIVHQGVGSLEALAATLIKSKTWYFWWD
jgi:hypothetical protein